MLYVPYRKVSLHVLLSLFEVKNVIYEIVLRAYTESV